MANIAFTEYYVVGQSDDLLRLKQALESLSVPFDGTDNEELNTLGLLVKSAGHDPSKIDCRGFWKPATVRMENGALMFEIESKWREPNQWRVFIERIFRVRMFYYTEQIGELILETNDAKGRYFPYRYYFDGSSDSPYFETIDELCEDVSELTGEENLHTYDDCSQAVAVYNSNHIDEPITLSKITVII